MSLNRSVSSSKTGILFFFCLLITSIEALNTNFKYDSPSFPKALDNLDCREHYLSILRAAPFLHDMEDSIMPSFGKPESAENFHSFRFPTSMHFSLSEETIISMRDVAPKTRKELYERQNIGESSFPIDYAWCAFGKVKAACKNAANAIKERAPDLPTLAFSQKKKIKEIDGDKNQAYVMRECLKNRNFYAEQKRKKDSVKEEKSGVQATPSFKPEL